MSPRVAAVSYTHLDVYKRQVLDIAKYIAYDADMPRLRLLLWMPLILLSACASHIDIPLLQAAQKGDSRTLEALLSQGADPNQKDAGGLTALILSARAGSAPAVQAKRRACLLYTSRCV